MGRVQPIDLWGLKSNCNGIVFPPISSTASKLLIDRREMRPPIPGAHPAAAAVAAQDGHREAETRSHVCGGGRGGEQRWWSLVCFFCSQSQIPPGWDPASSRRLNKIISFRDGPAVNQAALTYAKANEKRRKEESEGEKKSKKERRYIHFFIRLFTLASCDTFICQSR